jgi:hypothetical protein
MVWLRPDTRRQSQRYLTTDGQSASLSLYQATIWDQQPILLSLHVYYLQIFAISLVWGPLWREDGSVIYWYKCYWTLPALSLSGLSPVDQETIFYSLIWDWIPFLSPLPTLMATVETKRRFPTCLKKVALSRPRRKHSVGHSLRVECGKGSLLASHVAAWGNVQ